MILLKNSSFGVNQQSITHPLTYTVVIYLQVHLLYPRSTGGGYTVLPLSFHLSVCPSFHPSHDIFRHIFFSNLLMAEIWYLVTSFVFWPVRFLLPVCRFSWLYTHWTYMRGYHKWALTPQFTYYICPEYSWNTALLAPFLLS